MSVLFEKELENVAREIDPRPVIANEISETLIQKLLPLLEAGQEMRDWCYEFRELLIKGGFKKSDKAGVIIEAWDAARERLAQLEKR